MRCKEVWKKRRGVDIKRNEAKWDEMKRKDINWNKMNADSRKRNVAISGPPKSAPGRSPDQMHVTSRWKSKHLADWWRNEC